MVYITGDTHGYFHEIETFCYENGTTKDDVMIILGDAGINYFMDYKDKQIKSMIQDDIPITLLCIHGNHEQRPYEIASYQTKVFNGGIVWYEEDYPNILFADDGEVFKLNGKAYLVIGGAYSVDKQYRLMGRGNWWDNEQPSDEIKSYVEQTCNFANWKFDGILTHTCPLKYEPVEVFLPGIDQTKVDKSTEEWLGTLEEKLDYEKWYCGHYHTDKNIDKIKFMYKNIEELK